MNLLPTKRAAALLQISTSTLAKMRLTGRGPRYRKHGGKVVYELSDLEHWSELGIRQHTSDTGLLAQTSGV